MRLYTFCSEKNVCSSSHQLIVCEFDCSPLHVNKHECCVTFPALNEKCAELQTNCLCLVLFLYCIVYHFNQVNSTYCLDSKLLQVLVKLVTRNCRRNFSFNFFNQNVLTSHFPIWVQMAKNNKMCVLHYRLVDLLNALLSLYHDVNSCWSQIALHQQLKHKS